MPAVGSSNPVSLQSHQQRKAIGDVSIFIENPKQSRPDAFAAPSRSWTVGCSCLRWTAAGVRRLQRLGVAPLAFSSSTWDVNKGTHSRISVRGIMPKPIFPKLSTISFIYTYVAFSEYMRQPVEAGRMTARRELFRHPEF